MTSSPAAAPANPSPGSTALRLRWAECALVLLAAAYSIFFYATLPGRMPSDADYAAVSGAIHAELAAGDEVAVAPEWAERARMMLPGVPFLSPPDLTRADFSRARRLWLIGLPDVPRSDLDRVQQSIATKLTVDGPEQRFGRLTLRRYLNANFREPLFDFTRDVGRARVYLEARGQQYPCTRDGQAHHCPRGPTVQHDVREIDFAPYDCVGANPIGQNVPLVVEYPDALLGEKLRVMAAVTGEMGWRHTPGLTPVTLDVDIDGQRAGSITLPVGTVPPQRTELDTKGFDASKPHDVRFSVTTANGQDREFCFDAQAD